MRNLGEEQHPLAPKDPLDTELTQYLHNYLLLLQLMLQHFTISPLPNGTLPFAIQALQTAESSWICDKKSPTSPRTKSLVYHLLNFYIEAGTTNH